MARPKGFNTTKRENVFNKFNGKCSYCGTDLDFNSFESITNYLVKNKGALFDPHIVDIVVNNIENENRLSITKKRILDVFDIRNEINKITKRINAKSR